MSWAFWRWARRRASSDPAPHAHGPQPPGPAAPTAQTRPATDEPHDDQPRTPAFSGASPQPGTAGRRPPEPGSGLTAEPADPAVVRPTAPDLPALRGDVLDLVRAALQSDRAAAAAVLQRLTSRGADEPELAAILAVGALGDRLVEAAGYEPDEAPPGSLGAAAVLAQGDLVAGRADALLRAVAPQHSRDLARFVVRLAAGVPADEPAVAELAEAPGGELVLVAGVLLAQTVLDGGGDLDRLAEQLDGPDAWRPDG